ncbi:MAG TPA: hypothetical protein VGL03_06065, partial [Thermoanaerobaculia bacterium]
FANLLFHYTGNPAHRRLAIRAMEFLAVPEVAQKFTTASVLLVDREISSAPMHLTVVGGRADPKAHALLAAALADPQAYKRVELFDRRDGPLPNSDVEFPDLDRAAAFVCTSSRCSLPAFTPEERIARLRANPATP